MHDPFDADLAKHEEALMTVLRSVVSECRGRGAHIRKGMLLVHIKVESAKLATGFSVQLILRDKEMTPLDDPRFSLPRASSRPSSASAPRSASGPGCRSAGTPPAAATPPT